MNRVVVAAAVGVLLSGCSVSIGFKPPHFTPAPSPSPSPTAPLQAAPSSLHPGEVESGYVPVALSATGGVPPYTWSVAGGALPDGLTLSSSGSLSGTPSKGGAFSFSLQVADSTGTLATRAGAIKIAPSLEGVLIPACAKFCSVEVGCVNVCGAFGLLTGGTAPFTYALKPGGLVPAGTHLNGFSLAGTFTQKAQFFQFTVVATDAFGETATVTPTFYVFAHLTLAGGTCSTTFYISGCSASLAYGGGSPAGLPKVQSISASGTLCLPPNYTCPSPDNTLPPGLTATVSQGVVVIAVAPAGRPGFAYNGNIMITIVDSSLCGASSQCSATSTVALSIGLG